MAPLSYYGPGPGNTKTASKSWGQFLEEIVQLELVCDKQVLGPVHILRNTEWEGGVFPIYYNITWGD